MKKTGFRVAAAAAAVILCAVFAAALLVYIRPMEDGVYDLSMTCQSEAVPADWVFDDKGWTVYVRNQDRVTELAPDGFGGFTGLPEPGQTFYFSRTMTETLDRPTLRLDAANRNIAVFLDDELLYTDCPELDNRVGYLTLPMLEWDRTEQIVVNLPDSYAGRTLTVAQSTSPGGEKQEPESTVWPCAVTLYCGYAYESGLIAESFQTAIPAAWFFLAGVFLLAVFVAQVFRGKRDPGLVFAALTAFLWMASRMAVTSFALYYFGQMPADPAAMCRQLALTALLAYLTVRMTGRRRTLLLVLTGIQGAAALVYLVLQCTGTLFFGFLSAMYAADLAALLAAFVCGFFERRRGCGFYRLFCPLTSGGLVLWIALLLVIPAYRSQALQQMALGSVSFFLWPVMLVMLAVTLAAASAEAVRREINRRTEVYLLMQRQELTQAGYEAMRRQHEEVMMLRHDMAKHLRMLRQMTSESEVAGYIDELMGQNEKIRSVVQSGNEILDIIINSRLSEAADAGIRVEIPRMQAPEKLPVSDAELSSLMMNILDNAVAAACGPGVEDPYIVLDAHIKNDFFVFVCRNATARNQTESGGKKPEGLPVHGLGLKIIRQIAGRYGDLLEAEHSGNEYKVMLALPLNQPSR
ncbi:MAG: sensor histidine kinase [Anaerovoracaceae bacterium]